ncbi:MAG: citramalate synthase [Cyanobacteria bacterium P01_D01_bin.105]
MTSSRRVLIYDTTLRDGIQRHGIACTLEDKIKIAKKLDSVGVPFIEGGWPGANTVDTQLFEYFQHSPLQNSQLVAFGSTRRSHQKASENPTLKALIEANTLWLTIFGKSWDLHVTDALKVSLDENLAMIQDSVEFLHANGRRVIYDAEHWFDGYQANPDYALQTLAAALTGGAEWLVLCDTNGGKLPKDIERITAAVQTWLQDWICLHPQKSDTLLPQLGIHTHNDSGTAVASSLAAIDAGAAMVHGTINGYGERCGNADLCSVIPDLQLKMGYSCIDPTQLTILTQTSRFVSEIVNLAPDDHAPYVGRSAFAHKGGIHISAVERNPKTYEHIHPEAVGNDRRIVISSSSGGSTILAKAKSYNIDLKKDNPAVRRIANNVKEMESRGYQFEAAEASFEMLMRKELGQYKPMFQLKGYEVNYDVLQSDVQCNIGARATVKVIVCGEDVLEVAECMGPVSALDKALRKALVKFYPIVERFHLTDYKVRILNSEAGTAAKIRVLVESSDGDRRWSTLGVSVNILEASYQAVAAGIEYGLQHSPHSTQHQHQKDEHHLDMEAVS